MVGCPQISNGALAVYPVTKGIVRRSVVNLIEDGRSDVLSDPDAVFIGWELRQSGLTRAEWTAIETLFQQTSGKWGSFTFLDPTGNLLAQSESFGNPVWTNGPLLQLTPGIADPLGTLRATRVVNGSQADEAITQTLNVPGSFQYRLSACARTTAGSRVTLAVANVAKSFALGSPWQRVFVAANPGQADAHTVTL